MQVNQYHGSRFTCGVLVFGPCRPVSWYSSCINYHRWLCISDLLFAEYQVSIIFGFCASPFVTMLRRLCLSVLAIAFASGEIASTYSVLMFGAWGGSGPSTPVTSQNSAVIVGMSKVAMLILCDCICPWTEHSLDASCVQAFAHFVLKLHVVVRTLAFLVWEQRSPTLCSLHSLFWILWLWL